ncbi:conjugal transfer protein TraB [Streptomyces axinellae]|uniref:Conjugal transfer protein TraB n=1 Tax=Streptomyces axinellae TaxID=552788 RepID=A0ABP6DG25_9ACTN
MAGELEPYRLRLPARIGGGLSFLRLAAKMTALTTQALALKEGLWSLKRRIEHDSAAADRLAEMSGAAKVEPKFCSLIHEAAGSLRKVADASGGLAGAADTVEAAARAVTQAHRSEYQGVYEAVNASGVQQATAGFYRTRG